MQEKPITIRAKFGNEYYVSYHWSPRASHNWRWHAREIADMAVSLGADWAQGWIAGERVCWIVAMEAEETLGLAVPEGQRRGTSDEIWAALEEREPMARTMPPAWVEE